ncbi:unnamed protein product [Knipowitschia caucasica]|uniref:EGF-like domain-containing protein n=1 Tax=Knipowitschia caucasica TaxID=637954 RepID=A0AAV2KDI9_KNICA
MKAGARQLNPALLVVFVLELCFYSASNSSELQVCDLCYGTVRAEGAVGQFCSKSAGRIEGRCCLQNDTAFDHNLIIGLDLSNCSLAQVGNIQDASAARIIDLSLNPKANISDTTFQGFIELDRLILPIHLLCPGGATSWKKIEKNGDQRLCEGQNSMCNQTVQMSTVCPENSQCAPFGPGLSQCSCAADYHGYKCLREGKFPVVQVLGPLGASTVVFSLLMWVTQRRKAKPL